jgi:predicted GNAT superfamily acetyltransferase
MDTNPIPAPPTAADLGFTGNEASGWTRSIRGRKVQFRLLRTLHDLSQAEHLQEEVFGVSERDLIPANELIVVAETGGAVIGAFVPAQAKHAAGIIVGWGGFIGRPRLVSDFLAVRPEARNLGLAAELKRLQAVIALERDFVEIVWTVDPLRAANARLNFGKLGAIATGYEIDRYGSGFAPRLYGGMPSDRLHVTWNIRSQPVIELLLSRADPVPSQGQPLPPYTPDGGQTTARVDIPADIDTLLTENPRQAHDWRLLVRESLLGAFSEGFAVTGFQPADHGRPPALILDRLREPKT